MALPQQNTDAMNEADYLALAESADVKHEYAQGQVIAMTDGTARHSFITVNTSTTLNVQLAEADCRVAAPDLRLKVESKTSYRYPDVMVICGELDYAGNRADTIINPRLIVEVLSPSTAFIDRNDKFLEYIQIPSVQEYILIAQHTPRIERFSRQADDEWLYKQVTGLDATLKLEALDCVLELATVYAKITFDDE